MKSLKPADKRGRLVFAAIALVLAAGIIARFYVMTKGHNFDFESYKIIADIVGSGGNVYAETARYNYGPVWFTILGIFHAVGSAFSNPELVFRVLIVGLLTSVDIAIAFILKRQFGLMAFVLFFLNPISIIITGYHNQFDNLAILIGLLGLLVMPKPGAQSVTKRHVYSALLIGLSLMTKHIMFVIPLWLFIREKSLKVKLAVMAIPIAVFALGFLPFLASGYEGILHNVFMYKSFANAPLLTALVSPEILAYINPMFLMIVALIVVGFMTRRLPALEAGLWYLLTLVIFAPAIANQYLAIVMAAVSAFGFVFFIPFVACATLLLSVTSVDGIHAVQYAKFIPEKLLPYITQDAALGQYRLIIVSLFVGAVLATIYRYRRHWYGDIYRCGLRLANEQLGRTRKRRRS